VPKDLQIVEFRLPASRTARQMVRSLLASFHIHSFLGVQQSKRRGVDMMPNDQVSGGRQMHGTDGLRRGPDANNQDFDITM
jgi:hypothetical protein